MDTKNVVKIILTAFILQSFGAGFAPVCFGDVFGQLTNYPNPFDSREGSTTICYTLTAESEVKADIYDLLGNLVREYPSRIEPAGIKTVVWDGTDLRGSKVAKGGYILSVEIKNGMSNIKATRKIGVIH